VESVKKDKYEYVENTNTKQPQAVYAEAPKKLKLTKSNYVGGDFDEFDA